MWLWLWVVVATAAVVVGVNVVVVVGFVVDAVVVVVCWRGCRIPRCAPGPRAATSLSRPVIIGPALVLA